MNTSEIVFYTVFSLTGILVLAYVIKQVSKSIASYNPERLKIDLNETADLMEACELKAVNQVS